MNELVIPTIRALADENVLVVATTARLPISEFDLTPLPANLRLEQFIPFYRLMPYVDVMVTNGGFGGVQLALSNGVPLVVAGATEEKPEIAARLAWGGVGIDLKTGKPSEQQIREAVKTILTNPSYRSNAKRLQVEFDRYHAPKMSADPIERSIVDFRRE